MSFYRKNKTWISSAHQGYAEGEMYSNTSSAYYKAAVKGADMIETEVRMTKDGIIVVNHDPVVIGFDKSGNEARHVIADTDSSIITSVILAKDDPYCVLL